MTPISYEDVDNYLEHNRTLIGLFGIYFLPRCEPGLKELGITYAIAKTIVLDLTPEQYVSGPITDELYPYFNVWIFGASIPSCSEMAYIKFSDRREKQQPVCISFHKAKYQLAFPFENNKLLNHKKTKGDNPLRN